MDDTLPKSDSRSEGTNDSWEDTSAAFTDRFGVSPGREDDEEDSLNEDRGPSPACTSGEESG